jgi:hypothetical protein
MNQQSAIITIDRPATERYRYCLQSITRKKMAEQQLVRGFGK